MGFRLNHGNHPIIYSSSPSEWEFSWNWHGGWTGIILVTFTSPTWVLISNKLKNATALLQVQDWSLFRTTRWDSFAGACTFYCSFDARGAVIAIIWLKFSALPHIRRLWTRKIVPVTLVALGNTADREGLMIHSMARFLLCQIFPEPHHINWHNPYAQSNRFSIWSKRRWWKIWREQKLIGITSLVQVRIRITINREPIEESTFCSWFIAISV